AHEEAAGITITGYDDPSAQLCFKLTNVSKTVRCFKQIDYKVINNDDDSVIGVGLVSLNTSLNPGKDVELWEYRPMERNWRIVFTIIDCDGNKIGGGSWMR